MDPADHLLSLSLGLALVGLRKYEEAVESLRKAAPISLGFCGWALGLAGQRQAALGILDDLERHRSQEYGSSFFMALVDVGLGEHDQAISRLERAAEDRDPMMPELSVWPGLDPLRSDPRFQALLRRMKFPETATSG